MKSVELHLVDNRLLCGTARVPYWTSNHILLLRSFQLGPIHSGLSLGRKTCHC